MTIKHRDVLEYKVRRTSYSYKFESDLINVTSGWVLDILRNTNIEPNHYFISRGLFAVSKSVDYRNKIMHTLARIILKSTWRYGVVIAPRNWFEANTAISVYDQATIHYWEKRIEESPIVAKIIRHLIALLVISGYTMHVNFITEQSNSFGIKDVEISCIKNKHNGLSGRFNRFRSYCINRMKIYFGIV